MATSVAIGPDGAYYVTELKGFPAPTGESRVWRIEPGTRHEHCDADAVGSPCTVVADGFTSIVDLTFGADGTAYVVELTRPAGSRSRSSRTPGGWNGELVRPDHVDMHRGGDWLDQPMAAAENDSGVFVVVSALIPGETAVVPLV